MAIRRKCRLQLSNLFLQRKVIELAVLLWTGGKTRPFLVWETIGLETNFFLPWLRRLQYTALYEAPVSAMDEKRTIVLFRTFKRIVA